MSDRSHLRVNGDDREYDEGAFPKTVSALISELALNPVMIVAEVNGNVISRADFPTCDLHSGDEIELVRFVGGG